APGGRCGRNLLLPQPSPTEPGEGVATRRHRLTAEVSVLPSPDARRSATVRIVSDRAPFTTDLTRKAQMDEEQRAALRWRGQDFIRKFLGLAEGARDLMDAMDQVIEPNARCHLQNGDIAPPA